MPRDDPREAAQHVIERDEAVGQDHALDRRVRDVALVPQRDVLERRHGSCRASAAPGRRSARSRSGCACAASPTSPSGPCANGSSTSPISVFCRPRISSANFSSDAPVIASADSSSAWRSRWITCDATGAGSRPSRAQTSRFDRGRRCANVPTAPESLPTRRPSRARAHALDDRAAARRTRAPASGRRSSARRGRRGCGRSSASADARTRASRTASASAVEVLEDDVARLAHLQRLRGVDDVRRGQAEVQPARRRPDLLGDRGRERDHVVLGGLLRSLRCARCRRRRARGCRARRRRERCRRRPWLRRRRFRRAARSRSGAGRSRCAPISGWV